MAESSLPARLSPADLSDISLEPLLNKLSDPILIVDHERRLLFANLAAERAMDTLKLGRDLAMSWRHPDALEAVDACLSSDESQSIEFRVAAPVRRTLQLEAVPLDGTDPGRVMVVLRDITSARTADQVRQDFVANVSHELRSPIASLIGFIETLQGPAKDDADATERFLAIMQDEAGRMSRLIDDLLSLSRVEVSEHMAPRDKVDVASILGMAVEILAGRAAEKGMEIRLDLADDLPLAAGEKDELMEVFQNLVDNAVKYGRADTPVSVRAAKVDRLPDSTQPGIVVEVTNRGDVIAAEDLPRLTERFYRVDKGRSRNLGGTGLGLAIVKHIISRHRGRLAIESNEKTGTTFSVYLPAALSQ